MNNSYFKNDSPNTFRISKNQILRLINEKNEQVYIPIPLGLNLDLYDQLMENDDYVTLSSSEKQDSDFFKVIRLLKNPESSTYDNFEVSLIYDTIDYQKALNLLHHEHYILALPIGLPIILKKNKKIIGVIYFSKLTHGNPDGRINYITDKHNFQSLKEIRKYANLHIGCIDRIVIDSEFQGKNAGRIFSENLDSFLKEIFINNELKAIEVMTSWTLDEFIKKGIANNDIEDINEVFFAEERDFFCRASFSRISQKNPEVKNPRKEREDKGRRDKMDRKSIAENGVITHVPEKVIRYYYIKDI